MEEEKSIFKSHYKRYRAKLRADSNFKSKLKFEGQIYIHENESSAARPNLKLAKRGKKI